MIRELKSEDLDGVMAIWLSGNKQAHDFVEEDYWDGHYDEVRTHLPDAEVYLYEEAGRIKGFIGMEGGYIAGIFVESGSRSEGIGRRLLDHVKRNKPGLTLRVYEKNERAVRFYRREEFTIKERQVDQDTGATELLMAWERKGGSRSGLLRQK